MAETSPPPPTTLSDIPDIIANILYRLPVKSLLRLRAVSKPWCSQIDSSKFVKQHLQHSLQTNTNKTLILRHKEPHFSSIDCDTLKKAVKLHHPLEKECYRREVVGCCDGLVAFLHRGEDNVVLWNPSTKKIFELPLAPLRFEGDSYHWCEYIAFGLGYDPVTSDYKIVRNTQFYQGGREDVFDSRVQVFSLRTGYWRRIQDCAYYFKNRRIDGVFVGESVHWIACKKPKSDSKDLVVAFDLRTEEFKEVDQPDYENKGKEVFKYIVNFGGCLCILVRYNDAEAEDEWDISIPSHVDVWTMKEYGVKQSWTKLFTVGNPENIRHLTFVFPLMYSKCGNKVLLNLDENKLVWFDLIGKIIEGGTKIRRLPDAFRVGMCVRSLVSPIPCPVDPEKMATENLSSVEATMKLFSWLHG